MEELTILQNLIEFLATDKANIIFTSISHFTLLIALVYSVIHLVKMMFEPAEKQSVFKETVSEVEKLIS